MILDRRQPPPLPVAPEPSLPRLARHRLDNGLEVVIATTRQAPVVDVTLLVHAGAVRDPAEVPGLATFTAGMLDEGAGARTSLEIADEIETLGGTLTTSAGIEMAQVNLHVPVVRLEPALRLMADVALAPTFPPAEVARQRALRQASLLQLRDQPNAIAPLAFNAILFGGLHPYGRPPSGTDASTERLDRTAIAAFYAAHYRPRNARLLVVGDVTPERVLELLAPRFGAWPDGAIEALPSADPPRPAPRAIYIVDKPGAPQSVIRIGNVGLPRATPDYHAAEVMNTVLGGSFTSRLNRNLRETHGFTYGASSIFEMRRLPGPFRSGAAVGTTVTDRAVVEFLKELRAIRDERITPPERVSAQEYLALGLPGEFETTSGTGQKFAELLANDLPDDTWDRYVPGVRAVTLDDVQQVAQRAIDPDHFVILIVGDRRAISSGLAALDEGALVERDLWGAEV